MSRILANIKLDREHFQIDINLNLPGKGVSALFGPSGSGKSSLLRCIAGLEKELQGMISVNGDIWFDSQQNIYLHSSRRKVGYVFQEAALFDHLSVKDNILYGVKRIKDNGLTVSVDDLTSLMGVEHLLNRYPEKLSGGEKQRVAIARALAVNPQLLLMDEPMASLDLTTKTQLIPYLEMIINQLDIPVIYVSHSPDEVTRFASHIVMIEEGEVKASGSLMNMISHIERPHNMDDEVMIVSRREWVKLKKNAQQLLS